MPIYRCQIEPLEPILFGDHRAARAGVDHLQLDQDPSPVTIHGALGTFVLRRRPERWPTAVLGELQRDVFRPHSEMAELVGYGYRSAQGSPLFPRPRHLRCQRGGPSGGILPVDLLSPREVPASRASTQEELPCLMRVHPPSDGPLVEEVDEPVWITRERLAEVLVGRAPTSGVGLTLEDEVFRLESRPGIAVDSRAGQVFEGAFFTRPYRRFAPVPLDPSGASLGAGFTAWFRTLEPFHPGDDQIGFLGGDRRRARFLWSPDGSDLSDVLAEVRTRVEEAAEKTAAGGPATRGFLLYLLTPALARDEPFRAAGVDPVAAVRGPAGQVSGWNVRGRHPRPLHNLVPAGSVYFYPWPEDTDRSELVRSLWLQPLRKTGGAVGFGRCLVGVWR